MAHPLAYAVETRLAEIGDGWIIVNHAGERKYAYSTTGVRCRIEDTDGKVECTSGKNAPADAFRVSDQQGAQLTSSEPSDDEIFEDAREMIEEFVQQTVRGEVGEAAVGAEKDSPKGQSEDPSAASFKTEAGSRKEDDSGAPSGDHYGDVSNGDQVNGGIHAAEGGRGAENENEELRKTLSSPATSIAAETSSSAKFPAGTPPPTETSAPGDMSCASETSTTAKTPSIVRACSLAEVSPPAAASSPAATSSSTHADRHLLAGHPPDVTQPKSLALPISSRSSRRRNKRRATAEDTISHAETTSGSSQGQAHDLYTYQSPFLLQDSYHSSNDRTSTIERFEQHASLPYPTSTARSRHDRRSETYEMYGISHQRPARNINPFHEGYTEQTISRTSVQSSMIRIDHEADQQLTLASTEPAYASCSMPTRSVSMGVGGLVVGGAIVGAAMYFTTPKRTPNDQQPATKARRDDGSEEVEGQTLQGLEDQAKDQAQEASPAEEATASGTTWTQMGVNGLVGLANGLIWVLDTLAQDELQPSTVLGSYASATNLPAAWSDPDGARCGVWYGPKKDITDPELLEKGLVAHMMVVGLAAPEDESQGYPSWSAYHGRGRLADSVDVPLAYHTVLYPQNFFVKGKILRIAWPHSVQELKRAVNKEDNHSDDTTFAVRRRRKVYESRHELKSRCFLVLQAGEDCSTCFLVSRYNMDDKIPVGRFSLIHDPASLSYKNQACREPEHPAYAGLVTLYMDESTNGFHPHTMQVDYSKLYSIKHNVQVCDIGMLREDSKRSMKSNFWRVVEELRELNKRHTQSSKPRRRRPSRNDRFSVDTAHERPSPIGATHIVHYAIARWAFEAKEVTRQDIIEMLKGDRVGVHVHLLSGWSSVYNFRTGETGVVPTSYLQLDSSCDQG